MQLVEQGMLDLEDPVSDHDEAESQGVVRVKHLLSMTSEGKAGSRYNYSGDRYALLSQVIERSSGRPFQQLLFERILEPLGMSNTTPTLVAHDMLDQGRRIPRLGC